jgi:serine/threonine-protein kinase
MGRAVAKVLRRGSRLGKYRLDRQIGRGAFAEVWKARDTVENRGVALKVTHPDAVTDWGRRAVEREARIASCLHHPGIAVVRNADWIDGRFVIATDLAKTSLSRYTRARRSGSVALEVIRQVAAGLAYAHDRRVMHRDVKPENILIFEDGRAALTDFGASRFAADATRTYTDAGTLGYMAPEQAYGRARLASDVFSLGLIAYELLTGRLPAWPFEWPFSAHDRFEAKVPEPIRPVLRKAAQFDPRRRYPDAVALHQALERAMAKVKEPPPRRAPRRGRRGVPTPSPLAVQAEAFRRAHGPALGLRYACRRCEGPISEAMRFCPWCGSSENSFLEITSFPLVCPECEKGVRPEWSYCPWCYKGRFVPNGRRPPADPRAVRRCGRRGCSGQLRPFMRYCPLCKWKPRRPWTAPELPNRCPRCRWPTHHAFLRFCPWCGRREARAGSFVRARNGRG